MSRLIRRRKLIEMLRKRSYRCIAFVGESQSARNLLDECAKADSALLDDKFCMRWRKSNLSFEMSPTFAGESRERRQAIVDQLIRCPSRYKSIIAVAGCAYICVEYMQLKNS